ncbi:hypothetical protein ACJMK2_008906 [Sinanodonta woodiana]|uniref:Diguanylate cyclase n=1 Tax=Sinanodonta woodiana TaxID=1069815 RepID=A0ABD3VCX5_SINWO
MSQQLSTSVSDFALVLSIVYVLYNWYHRSVILASVGLGIQALAASVGVVRFAMHRSNGTPVFYAHKFLSWLATALGMPLVAYSFCTHYRFDTLAIITMVFSATVVASAAFMPTKNREDLTQAASGLAVLSILFVCLVNMNLFGVAACIVYIISGLVIGSSGEFAGIQRVDLLHYALVIGNVLFSMAL